MHPASYESLFSELVILLLAAAAAGYVSVRLKQPPIIGFIAAGILAGPSCLGWIRSVDQIQLFAEMGLALLLFIVGLKLDINVVRSMGTASIAIGLGQVVITTAGGYLLCLALGMDAVTSLYVAVALTFSSTIIIIKLLSDKHETESLHGRIAIGLLIVQDIVVVLAMILLSAFSGNNTQQPLYQALSIALKGAGLLVASYVLGAVVAPRLLFSVARSAELLVLFAIVWALALAVLSQALGFSKEIGAFVAGVTLASTPFRDTIGAKLSSLRDFLLLFFFIELGSRFDISSLGSQVWASIPLSLFVLIGNPLIMLAITGYLGYRKRTSLLAGLTVGQVSEFSLILIAMGARLGHIESDAVGVVTLVTLVTIGLSTYSIIYSQQLYSLLSPYIGIFERKRPYREDSQYAADSVKQEGTMVFGLGSYGTGIASQFEDRGRHVIGVDFDPVAIRDWRNRGGTAIFGDAGDPEIVQSLHLSSIDWVISSVRGLSTNESLLGTLRHRGYAGKIGAAAYDATEAEKLRAAGADCVFSPFEDAAIQAADLVFAIEDHIARQAMDKLIDSMSDHYVICGYGRMGQQIVKDLMGYNVPCVVVEHNPEQLPKLKAGDIPHVEGKASEDNALLKAGIERAKGLIAVAPSDEENVFIVLTAKVLNPGLFVVARSILQENEDKLRHAGADRVMSPYVLGGRRMAAAVIKPEVMDFLDLVVHEDGEDTEMAVVVVDAGSKCIGMTLREANPWESCGATLLAVRKPGEKLRPNPSADLVVGEGDELIVMGTCAQIDAARQLLSAKQ